LEKKLIALIVRLREWRFHGVAPAVVGNIRTAAAKPETARRRDAFRGDRDVGGRKKRKAEAR
jgi:hypothetical protein